MFNIKGVFGLIAVLVICNGEILIKMLWVLPPTAVFFFMCVRSPPEVAIPSLIYIFFIFAQVFMDKMAILPLIHQIAVVISH